MAWTSNHSSNRYIDGSPSTCKGCSLSHVMPEVPHVVATLAALTAISVPTLVCSFS